MRLKGEKMIKNYVWDTGALFQFFAENQKAIDLMRKIENGKSNGYIPQLVYSEFYYKTWQKLGRQAALIRVNTLRNSILKEYILTEADTLIIGKAKLDYSFISMVDGIVYATAKAKKSTIITTDSDFIKIKDIKVIKLDF